MSDIGPVGRVLGSQIPSQDEYSLGVDGAAHVDFTLDVYHLAFTEAMGGRDAAGPSEHVVSDGRDG